MSLYIHVWTIPAADYCQFHEKAGVLQAMGSKWNVGVLTPNGINCEAFGVGGIYATFCAYIVGFGAGGKKKY